MKPKIVKSPSLNLPLALPTAILLLSLLAALSWPLVLLLNLIGQPDLQTIYHRWMLVHAVEQFWGWAGLALFALLAAYLRRTSEKKSPYLAGLISRLLLLLGLLCFTTTLFLQNPVLRGSLYIIASTCLILPAIFFTVDCFNALAGRGLDAGWLFILAATQWLLIWVAADLVIHIKTRDHGEPQEIYRALLIQLSNLGFVANLLFGLALRLLPQSLHITRLRPRAFLIALLAYNIGLIQLLVATYTTHWLAPPAALFMFAGALFFIIGFNFFSSNLTTTAAPHTRARLVIKIAFAWLLLSLAMTLAQQIYFILDPTAPLAAADLAGPIHAFTSAARHAFAAGFITLFLFGLAQTLIVNFLPPQLTTPKLFALAALLLLLGLLWRTTLQLLKLNSNDPWITQYLGLSGILEVAATLLFALALLRAILLTKKSHIPF